jgi:hypothetical protein
LDVLLEVVTMAEIKVGFQTLQGPAENADG